MVCTADAGPRRALCILCPLFGVILAHPVPLPSSGPMQWRAARLALPSHPSTAAHAPAPRALAQSLLPASTARIPRLVTLPFYFYTVFSFLQDSVTAPGVSDAGKYV